MGETLSVEKPVPSTAVPPAVMKEVFTSKELSNVKILHESLRTFQNQTVAQYEHVINYQRCTTLWKVLHSTIQGDGEGFLQLVKKMTKSPSSTSSIQLLWREIEKCDDVTVPEELAAFKTASVMMRMSIECSLALSVSGEWDDEDAIERCVVKLVDMVKKHIEKSLSDPYSDDEVEVKDISLEDFSAFCASLAPQLPKLFETFFVQTAFFDIPNSCFVPFVTPFLAQPSAIVSSPLDIIHLAYYKKAFQDKWHRLYTSNSDGFSFNRLTRSFNGYDGPVVFLIKTAVKEGPADVLLVFGATKFRDSNRFYGDSNVFLGKLQPSPRIFEATITSNKNYIWLNEGGFGLPHGLGLGGEEKRGADSFRLFIPTTLERCRAASSCNTFENGCLLMNDPKYEELFDIHTIEVWAVGGPAGIDKGMQSLNYEREARDERVRQAGKVDKAEFFKTGFDSEFFLGETTKHRDEIQRDRI